MQQMYTHNNNNNSDNDDCLHNYSWQSQAFTEGGEGPERENDSLMYTRIKSTRLLCGL